MLWQIVQMIGAAMILAAFFLNQRRITAADAPLYLGLNLAGSLLLTLCAIVARQWGFLVLEGTWAVVSAAGFITGARRRQPSP
jgi:hypothetical protein